MARSANFRFACRRRRRAAALAAVALAGTALVPLYADDATLQNNLQRSRVDGRAQLVPAPIVLPDLGDPASSDLTPAAEREAGERVMREIRRDPDYLPDELLSDYLNTVGGRLVAAAKRARISGAAITFDNGYQLFGVRDRSINAFALPGGYIGVHTGLLAATDNEAELASVLAHEIGHVTQRHIARMVGAQQRNGMIAAATLLLGLLAATRSPDAAQALIIGGQALAVDNQLSFSRGAEREADRVGFQILDAAGYDVNAMARFFERLQRANALREAGAPGYLRTHPLTQERIAEIEDRARMTVRRVPPVSSDFALMRVRAQVLQMTTQGDWTMLRAQFETQRARATSPLATAAAEYGIALASQRLDDAPRAMRALEAARAALPDTTGVSAAAFDLLAVELALAQRQYPQALRLSALALQRQPTSRAALVVRIRTLLAAGQPAPAAELATQQTRRDPLYPSWWNLLAQADAALGQRAGQHRALAEDYALQGAWGAALDQLRLARAAGDADFYQLSEIDVRERQFKQSQLDERSAQKR